MFTYNFYVKSKTDTENGGYNLFSCGCNRLLYIYLKSVSYRLTCYFILDGCRHRYCYLCRTRG